MLRIQGQQPTKDQNTNNAQLSLDLSPESHHLQVKLNSVVEVSVVTLDTLNGKKTMISLTTRSTMKHVEQLLGFWEYDLPMYL
jgi:hypothetical protein